MTFQKFCPVLHSNQQCTRVNLLAYFNCLVKIISSIFFSYFSQVISLFWEIFSQVTVHFGISFVLFPHMHKLCLQVLPMLLNLANLKGNIFGDKVGLLSHFKLLSFIFSF